MSNKLEVHPADFDNRMIEWNLKHNKITRDQLKTYLSALPDEADKTQKLTIDESEGYGSDGADEGDLA